MAIKIGGMVPKVSVHGTLFKAIKPMAVINDPLITSSGINTPDTLRKNTIRNKIVIDNAMAPVVLVSLKTKRVRVSSTTALPVTLIFSASGMAAINCLMATIASALCACTNGVNARPSSLLCPSCLAQASSSTTMAT